MDTFISHWIDTLSELYLEDNIEDAISLILERWNKDIYSFSCDPKNTKAHLKDIENGNNLLPSLEAAPFASTDLSVNILHIFTHAICCAPNNSANLSRAYEIRSAVLFKTQLYEDSLKDIERALAGSCDDHLKIELYVRKAQNLLALNPSRSEIQKAVREARRMAKVDVDKKVIDTRLREITKTRSYPKPFVKPDNSIIMSDITDPHETLIGASNAIELKYSEQFGRHMVATRDIKIGETLIKHKAYSLMLPLNIHTHCWNCSRRVWSGVPCPQCIKVIFCDENCRNEAWNNFHDVECLIGDFILVGKPSTEELMGLRLAIRALKEAGSIELLKEKLKTLDSIQDPLKQGFTGDILDNTKYAGIYTLKSDIVNKSDIKLHAQRLTMCTFMLFIWACTSDTFGKKIYKMDELINNEFAVFMGRLILKNMRICDQNAHGVILRDNGHEFENALMLSCLTSYINHSCDSNASLARSGDTLVIKSIQPIKKGEQIFISYELYYQLKITPERQDYLKKHYNFLCDCKACKEDWNGKTKIPSFLLQPLPHALKIQLLSAYNSYKSKLNITPEEALKYTSISFVPIIIDFMNALSEHVSYPCNELCTHKNLLRLLYKFNSY